MSHNKTELRQLQLQRLKALPSEEAKAAARGLAEQFKPWIKEHLNQGVALFYPLPHEISLVELDTLLRQMLIPRYVPLWESPQKLMQFVELPQAVPLAELNKGELRSLTRVDPALIPVYLVPGIAFDKNGSRLGRGLGYYDRLLAHVRLKAKPQVVGVCFDFQVLDALPCEPHDQKMNWICTPQNGWVACTP